MVSHCFFLPLSLSISSRPYLTCRETLRYAAELYDVAEPEYIDAIVDEIVGKMGLAICKDTRNARLSGGQWRRLSIGIALLKNPACLFLDEPTSVSLEQDVLADGWNIGMV
jgi:ABC-type multidrug transport system ATPase subunit